MKETRRSLILKVALSAIFVFIAFFHINRGIDFADTGYNLANNELFPGVNHTWMLSTVLSMLIGKVLTFLPFGHTMLGMKVYCTLLICLFAFLIYKLLSPELNPVAIIMGEIIALLISWCPYVILYHYLGYFFFALAGLILVSGLRHNSIKTVAFSGIPVALNVLIRFPNICEVSLVCIIIFDMIIEKRNRIKEVAAFVAGFLITLSVSVLIIDLIFGFGSYIRMIKGLFSMTENAASYTPLSMLSTIFEGYRWDFKYFAAIALCASAMMFLYHFSRKKILKIASVLISAGTSLIVLRAMRYYGRISFDYTTHGSYYSLAVLIILLAVFVSSLNIFNAKTNPFLRNLGVLTLILIGVTPLGSNNGLYTLFCGLFAILPITFGLLWDKEAFLKTTAPLSCSVAVIALILTLQGALFKNSFVFGDISDEYVTISENESRVLAGMQTSPFKKSLIVETSAFLEKEGYAGTDAIIFGHIPMASYAFSLNNALSHIWPSLDSYSIEEFKSELESLGNHPVCIYASSYGDLLTKDFSDCYSEKEIVLIHYLLSNDYKTVFSNEMFTILK